MFDECNTFYKTTSKSYYRNTLIPNFVMNNRTVLTTHHSSLPCCEKFLPFNLFLVNLLPDLLGVRVH